MSGRELTKDPKYLFQIDGGAVDFFKTRPPSERGGGRVVLKMSICIVVEVPSAPRVLE